MKTKSCKSGAKKIRQSVVLAFCSTPYSWYLPRMARLKPASITISCIPYSPIIVGQHSINFRLRILFGQCNYKPEREYLCLRMWPLAHMLILFSPSLMCHSVDPSNNVVTDSNNDTTVNIHYPTFLVADDLSDTFVVFSLIWTFNFIIHSRRRDGTML